MAPQVRQILCLIWLTVLFGCTTAGPTSTPLDPSEFDNFAVASLLGDDFHLIHIGTTRFEAKQYVDSAASWNIDRFVTHRLKHVLGGGAAPRIGVLDRSEITHTVWPEELNLHKLVRAAHRKGFDTAIVVRRTSDPRAANIVGGYGLLHQRRYPTPGLSRCVFSALTIDVVDVQTMAILRSTVHQNCRPDIEVDYYPLLREFPAVELSLMREVLRNDISRSLMQALRAFGLI